MPNNGRRSRRALLAGLAATALVAATACSGLSVNSVESTAMVIAPDIAAGQVLFVDQDTQTPYFPTIPEGNVFDEDGNPIGACELETGNIVRVTGNGAMAESYPGQYPGITRVQVVSEGQPSDADRYADITAQVFSDPDEDTPAYGWVEYRTSDAIVTLSLEPVGYEWKRGDAEVSFVDIADCPAPTQVDAGDVIDAAVEGPCDASMTFSSLATGIEVERWPEADVSSGVAGDVGEAVGATLNEGAAALRIEPGYRYHVKATFDAGTANYVFTVRQI